MKKFIFLFLLAAMSISASAQAPVKYGDYYYTIRSYDDCATLVANPNKEGYSGDVVIPAVMKTEDGVEHKVIRIDKEAFSGCNILSVTIGSNITIGYRAFAYSTVASAIIGGEYDASVGTNSSIGSYAFYGCPNLASVVIGDNVGDVEGGAFQNCPSLSSIIIGKHVWGLYSSAFVGCNNLKDVYCYGENSPHIYLGRAFADDKLGSLTLHVPEAYYARYIWSDGRDNYPWQHFGTVEQLQSTELAKCATPEINYNEGTISFTCATEGVKFNSSVEYVENEFNDVSEYPAPSNFRVRAVAVKSGYLPSDVAVKEFALESYVDVNGDYKQGDVNKDSKVNVADHVKLTNIIMAP